MTAAADAVSPPPADIDQKPCPGVHSVRIPGPVTGLDGVVRFRIEYSVGACSYEELRRYRGFVKLRKELGPFHEMLSSPFPPKSVRKLKEGDDAMERRRGMLEKWLGELGSKAGAYWPRADDNRMRELEGKERRGQLSGEEEEELAELRPRNAQFLEQGVAVMARVAQGQSCDLGAASALLRRFLGDLPGWDEPGGTESEPPSPKSPRSSRARAGSPGSSPATSTLFGFDSGFASQQSAVLSGPSTSTVLVADSKENTVTPENLE
eukprot:TRINITY_DN842_c1_g1_i1.p2 TRINITY_DN842_c1_g1~~TRINITY_DN842_c1_g1_i1.p2  ORF type:complete len:265 (+),score=77.18 TRINITY_DN842_c1_g1_i1:52-846(+)